MARLQSTRFEEPDELVTLPLVTVQVVLLGEVHVARLVHQPGWSWAEHVKPVVGTPSCQHHHQGVVLEGEVEIETETGARRILRAGEAFEVPPGHDARVIGDKPFVTIEFGGVHGWAKPADAGERFVATLLVTDIVDSTKVAARLGDAAWKELLARHNEGVRIQRIGFAAWRSIRRATASLPSSTAQHELCGVRQRSAMARSRMVSRSVPASIRAK
jgi:hypothetical protein